MKNKKLSHNGLQGSVTSVMAALLCILIGLFVGFLVLLAINPAHAWADGFVRILKGGFHDAPYGVGTFHLCHDAFHIQAGVTVGLVIQNFDAALLQKRVKRFHIHPALGSQCLGLARRQGAFALRQQFLQSHAHFALSFSPRRWLRRK